MPCPSCMALGYPRLVYVITGTFCIPSECLLLAWLTVETLTVVKEEEEEEEDSKKNNSNEY